YLPLLLQFCGADRRHKAAVHPAGQKGTDRDIREHLLLYGVFYKPGRLLHRFFKRIFMWTALQLPVTDVPHRVFPAHKTVSGKHLVYSTADSFSICFRLPESKDLAESVPVDHRLHAGESEDPFQFRGKDQGISPAGVEQGLHSHSVPEQIQGLFQSIPESNGKNSI